MSVARNAGSALHTGAIEPIGIMQRDLRHEYILLFAKHCTRLNALNLALHFSAGKRMQEVIDRHASTNLCDVQLRYGNFN